MGYAKVPTKQLGSFKATVLQGVVCDSSVYVGALVRVDATTGEFINAIATSPENANVFGICSSKSAPTICDVVLPGSVTEALYSGLIRNDRHYLSSTVAGALSTTFPTAPGTIILQVGTAYTDTKLLLVPQLPIRRS